MGVAGSIFKPHPCLSKKKVVFFLDVKMILVSFFDILHQKSVNQEKTILRFKFRPTWVQKWPFRTQVGLNLKRKIGFS
jgi:hypothetical protein